MKVKGINHITLSTNDLNKSFQFYQEILGMKPLVKWERGAYFLVGDLWFCITLNKNTTDLGHEDYRHIALSVEQSDFLELKNKIISYGCKQWSQNTSEGDSFYFLDPDGHHLEIHIGDWQSRIESIKRNPFPGEVEFFI